MVDTIMFVNLFLDNILSDKIPDMLSKYQIIFIFNFQRADITFWVF